MNDILINFVLIFFVTLVFMRLLYGAWPLEINKTWYVTRHYVEWFNTERDRIYERTQWHRAIRDSREQLREAREQAEASAMPLANANGITLDAAKVGESTTGK